MKKLFLKAVDKLKELYHQNPVLSIIQVVTFVLIISTAIIFKQPFIRLLPLCMSLMIMRMIANVNRYAYLLGACNSVLYAVVYFSLTLYSSAAYSLLVSSPMTFMTFLNWNKKKQGGSTQLKRLTNMQRVFVAIACIIGWGLLYVVFNPQGSQYILLDNAVSVLGITTSVLAMLRYREYGVLSIMNYCAGVILYICMLPDNPGQITYLIYSLYTVCCAITTTINLRRM